MVRILRTVYKFLASILVVAMLCTPINCLAGISTGIDNPTATSTPTINSTSLIVHEPIKVNNDEELAAVAQSGDGTNDNPFVIADLEIDSRGQGNALYIGNTNAYVIIRGCYLHGATSLNEIDCIGGISLSHVTNATICDSVLTDNNYGAIVSYSHGNRIVNNTCSNNSQYGLKVDYSDSNYFSNIGCNNNQWFGLRLESSSSNVIENAVCNDNGVSGVSTASSVGNSFKNLTCSRNTHMGFNLGSSYYNMVQGCHISNNNYWGIEISGSKYNNISNNTCEKNGYSNIELAGSSFNDIENNTAEQASFGILLGGASSYNTIRNNKVVSNTNCGLFINDNSGHNLLYGNIITGAAGPDGQGGFYFPARDTDSNYWNSSKLGNLWMGWRNPDTNNDGVVDSPFLIVGANLGSNPLLAGGNNWDFRPMSPPLTNITTPQEGYETLDRAVTISWTCSKLGAIDHFEICLGNGASINVGKSTTYNAYLDWGRQTVAVGVFYSYLQVDLVKVNLTVGEIPSAPQEFTATRGESSISLAWTPPQAAGVPQYTYYSVYRDGVLVETTTALGYMDTNVTSGVAHSYEVAAYSVSGETKTAPINASPLGVPTPPLDLGAYAGDPDINLSWSSPHSDGGYAISSLDVYRVEGPDTVHLASLASGTIQYTDQSVIPGHTYRYYITATNARGVSAQSNTAGPVTSQYFTCIDIQSESSSSPIGAVISLTGRAYGMRVGQGIGGISVVLWYSVNGGNGWVELPSVTTDPDGRFTTQWIPTATGAYIIKASWVGTSAYTATESYFNVAVTASSVDNVFTVQSSSTISGLAFDSATKRLSFTVSGTTGTTGYTKIMISKNLVKDGSSIPVTLDGAVMNYTLSSTNSYWILYFTYHHSSHSIVANIGAGGPVGAVSDTTGIVLLVVPIVVVGALVSFVLIRRRKK